MGTIDRYAGMYPVKASDAWTWRFWIQADLEPKTVKQIAIQFNVSEAKVRRLLEPFVAKGYLYKRSESFWNGMFYATRWWYW